MTMLREVWCVRELRNLTSLGGCINEGGFISATNRVSSRPLFFPNISSIQYKYFPMLLLISRKQKPSLGKRVHFAIL